MGLRFGIISTQMYVNPELETVLFWTEISSKGVKHTFITTVDYGSCNSNAISAKFFEQEAMRAVFVEGTKSDSSP